MSRTILSVPVTATFTLLITYLLNDVKLHIMASPQESPQLDHKVNENVDLHDHKSDPITRVSQEIEDNSSEISERYDSSFEKLYAQGVKAYDQQLWHSCVDNIEKSIKGYKLYQRKISDCRLECSKGIRKSNVAYVTSLVKDFSHLVVFLRHTDCFRKCKKEFQVVQRNLPEKLRDNLERRMPYQYLQFCYFKLNKLKEAASAAYTFLMVNPDDADTQRNLVYYRDTALVPHADFVDLELTPHKEHYIRAMAAYADRIWDFVIKELEQSLVEYFKEYDRCLVDCDGKVTPRGSEFSTQVADMAIELLYCRLNCEEELSTIYQGPIKTFLQDIYHYLQFSYYQVKSLEKSAEATASMLLLNSSHAVMKDNKKILQEKLGYKDEQFVPRKDLVEYVQLRKEMYNLVNFINLHYWWPDHKNESSQEEVTETREDHAESLTTQYERQGVYVIAKSAELKKEGRFVTDGLLKKEQCEELLSLIKGVNNEKVGSRRFDLRIAYKRLQESTDDSFEVSLRQLLRASDTVSQFTLRFLDLHSQLYIRDVSLVCWPQPQDELATQECRVLDDGTCARLEDEEKAPRPDVYVSVTYLNSFEGDFTFLNEFVEVDSTFGVTCGRTVGYQANDQHRIKINPRPDENACAMMIRYTDTQVETSNHYRDIIALLHRMAKLRDTPVLTDKQEVLRTMESQGVKIVRTDELMGKERVLADGLATETQCTTLRNMVQIIDLVAAEYSQPESPPNFLSPHTEHESYQVITIYRAAKLTHQGMISTFGLQTFLDLSEKSRLLVETFFNLTQPLYFDYTHLVCRTAIDDTKTDRQDLSHPVHSDNCILQSDGSCTKDFPAFIHRDYSAILYLNADFEGGEFFFAHANKSEQALVRPKCGRLVGFNAGEFHGVKAVRSGQRCALALWFTLDPNYKELAHTHARKTLKHLEEEQKLLEKTAHEDL